MRYMFALFTLTIFFPRDAMAKKPSTHQKSSSDYAQVPMDEFTLNSISRTTPHHDEAETTCCCFGNCFKNLNSLFITNNSDTTKTPTGERIFKSIFSFLTLETPRSRMYRRIQE